MRVLVTGGCGFIGSNVINFLTNKYPNNHYYNIDRLDYCASEENINTTSNYTYIYGNICDKSLILHILYKYNINAIIHLAAQSHVDNSFGNSLQFTQDNVIGTHTLLECAKQYGKINKFVHMSTDEVYGEVDSEHDGCNEKSLLNPTNPYAATKAAAEFLCRSYFISFKFPVVIVRGNNVYGPNQYPEKLIPKTIQHIINNEKCEVHGNGETRRNFIHTDDVANAIDIIFQKGKLGEIYNIGSQNEFSVLEIIRLLLNHLKPDCNVEDNINNVQDRPFNDFRYSINCEKLKNLGWKESVDFNEGILDTITYYRKKFE